MTLQFTKRTLCDPSRPSVFLVSPESQLFAQARKCPSPMPRPSRQNLPSLPKQPVSFTMLFERKLDSLNASSLSNIITQSLLICICKKIQYGLINLPKRISTEKCDFKNSCQKVPMTIIGLIIFPGFSCISVQNWSFCGSCKRLHGRVAPSRHPPAITLHPVTAPPVTPKPNLGQKSDQES